MIMLLAWISCISLAAEVRSLSVVRPKHEFGGEVSVVIQSSLAPSISSQWRDAIDPSTGRTYYWNRKTRESRWERPDDEEISEADGGDASAAAEPVIVEATPAAATTRMPLFSRVSDLAARGATGVSALRKMLLDAGDGATGSSVVGKTLYLGGVFVAAAAIL